MDISRLRTRSGRIAVVSISVAVIATLGVGVFLQLSGDAASAPTPTPTRYEPIPGGGHTEAPEPVVPRAERDPIAVEMNNTIFIQTIATDPLLKGFDGAALLEVATGICDDRDAGIGINKVLTTAADKAQLTDEQVIDLANQSLILCPEHTAIS